MQHTHEQHMMESNQMRTRIQQLEAQAGDQSRVQRVAEVSRVPINERRHKEIYIQLFDTIQPIKSQTKTKKLKFRT